MATLDPTTKSTYATTDWDHYQKGRPPYPASLKELIYKYHRQHAGAQWKRLVDVGAGSGVAAANFLADFSTAHISDPSPANLEQARAFLSSKSSDCGTKLEYGVATGEHAHEQAGEGSADLVICATAAHFIDPDGLVSSAARMLRPGGTMAVFSYWMPTFPKQSAHFHDVFARTWDRLVLHSLQSAEPGVDLAQTRLAKVVARRMAGRGVLDSVPLPEDVFETPLRAYINPGSSGEIPYHDLFRKFEGPDRQPSGISRVSRRDQIVHYQTGADPEAEGWAYQVDRAWLSVMINTIRPENSTLSNEATQEAYAEWNEAFEEECPSKKLDILWPAYVVLARRK